MKNSFNYAVLLLLVVACFQTACIKDDCTQLFTYYEPVYRTKDEVRANIKSNTPQAIRTAGKIYIRGSYIFLNDIDRGIHIIDNSNPASPQLKAFITIPGNMDMAVKGNMLYADLYQDLVAIDITDPLKVAVKSYVNDAFPHRRYTNGFAADSNSIIVDWVAKTMRNACDVETFRGRRDVFMDAANGGTKSSSPFGAGGSMARFAITGNHLYTVSNQHLNTFSISNAAQPAFVKQVNMGWGIETIYPFKDKLFIGSNTGMFIYSIQNAGSPQQIGSFAHARVCDPVIAEDDFAFVTLRSGNTCAGFINQLDVVDISNLPATSLFKTYPMTNPHGLSKDGRMLFICDGADGLKILDASNPAAIVQRKHITGLDTYDVIAINGIALVVAKDGLYQYSYSNPDDIRLLSKITVSSK